MDSCESDASDALDDILEHALSSKTSNEVAEHDRNIFVDEAADNETDLLAPLPKLSLGGAGSDLIESQFTPQQEGKPNSEISSADLSTSSKIVVKSMERLSKWDCSDCTVVHQPQPPSVDKKLKARSTQSSLDPEAHGVYQGRPGEVRERPEPQGTPSLPSPSSLPFAPSVHESTYRAEAENLWKEQIRLEISCDILRCLHCVKARDSRAFKTATTELMQRVRLQEEARSRLAEIRSKLMDRGYTGNAGYTEEACVKLDQASRSSDQPLIFLEREARRLHEELLLKLRLRAEAEAKKALSEAERKQKDAEQRRRAAKASLAIRKNLSSDPKNGPVLETSVPRTKADFMWPYANGDICASIMLSSEVYQQFLQPKLRLKQSLQACEVTNSHSTTLADLNIVERSLHDCWWMASKYDMTFLVKKQKL